MSARRASASRTALPRDDVEPAPQPGWPHRVSLRWYESLKPRMQRGHEIELLETGEQYFPALEKAIDEATETVRRACERIGLPRPVNVTILPAAPWAGAAKAQHYPPYPEMPGRTQRVLTHVRLELPSRVRGPILLGAGRYLGLGLFRPEVEHA